MLSTPIKHSLLGYLITIVFSIAAVFVIVSVMTVKLGNVQFPLQNANAMLAALIGGTVAGWIYASYAHRPLRQLPLFLGLIAIALISAAMIAEHNEFIAFNFQRLLTSIFDLPSAEDQHTATVVSYVMCWIAAGLILLIVPGIGDTWGGSFHHVRGPQMQPLGDQEKRKESTGISWGGRSLPEAGLNKHFLVAGSTGSGKTLTIRLLMQEVIELFSKERKEYRAVVYDMKPEFYPVLRGLGIAERRIAILNPFDTRSASWAMAKDLTNRNHIQQFAHTLFPVPKESKDKFFDSSASELLRGVLIAFQDAWPCEVMGREWRLRDALLALRNDDDMLSVLAWVPEDNARRIQSFKQNDRSVRDILRTVDINVGEVEIIAALWEHAAHAISLSEWIEQGGVLVLGHSVDTPKTLATINRVFFHRLTQAVLKQPVSPPMTTWVFLDEVRRMAEGGPVDGLEDLVNEGRAKNVCVAIGFQDIAGLEKAFGHDATESLTSQFHNKAVFSLQGARSAKWAEALFSFEDVYAPEYSESSSSQGNSSTVSKRLMTRPVVSAGELASLIPPDATLGTPLSGFYRAYGRQDPYRSDIPLQEITKRLLPPASVPAFIERPGEQQKLKSWSGEEREALGLNQKSHSMQQHPFDGLDLQQ